MIWSANQSYSFVLEDTGKYVGRGLIDRRIRRRRKCKWEVQIIATYQSISWGILTKALTACSWDAEYEWWHFVGTVVLPCLSVGSLNADDCSLRPRRKVTQHCVGLTIYRVLPVGWANWLFLSALQPSRQIAARVALSRARPNGKPGLCWWSILILIT